MGVLSDQSWLICTGYLWCPRPNSVWCSPIKPSTIWDPVIYWSIFPQDHPPTPPGQQLRPWRKHPLEVRPFWLWGRDCGPSSHSSCTWSPPCLPSRGCLSQDSLLGFWQHSPNEFATCPACPMMLTLSWLCDVSTNMVAFNLITPIIWFTVVSVRFNRICFVNCNNGVV